MHRKSQTLLIDQEGMLRDGLCALINLEAGFGVAGAITGASALRTLSLPAAPDVIVADFGAPGVDANEVIEVARRRWPNVPILVLTFRRDAESIQAALRAGANGYLLKTDSREELKAGLRSAIEGKRYISPAICNTVVDGFVSKHSHMKQAEPAGLSDRECEVMRLIARGLRTREIAEKLSVSHKTVEKHRSNLMRKLGVRTAAAVAAYAISNGYVTP